MADKSTQEHIATLRVITENITRIASNMRPPNTYTPNILIQTQQLERLAQDMELHELKVKGPSEQ